MVDQAFSRSHWNDYKQLFDGTQNVLIFICFGFFCRKKNHSQLYDSNHTLYPHFLRARHGKNEPRESIPQARSRSCLAICCGRCPRKRCPHWSHFRREIHAPATPRFHRQCSSRSYCSHPCCSQSRGAWSSESSSLRPLAATASLFPLGYLRDTSLPFGLF